MRIVLAVIAGSMIGCAAVPPPVAPEAVFSGRSMDDAKAAIMAECVDRRIAVEDSGPNHVVCSRVLQGGQAVAMQLAIGNGYSSTPVAKNRFTFLPVGQDVRVVAQSWVETQMAFGQTRTMALESDGERRAMLEFLTTAASR
jgi:hypothetical protein